MALGAILIQKILRHWLREDRMLELTAERIPDVSLVLGREDAEWKQELLGITSFNRELVPRLA